MSYAEQEDQDWKGFRALNDESFEAHWDKDNNNPEFIFIEDCRMTKSTSENTNALGKFGIDPENDTIITLYLKKGRVFENEESGKKTAAGQCVFFKLKKSDHGEIINQKKLRIKRSALFYYKNSKSGDFHRTSFSMLTNIITDTNTKSAMVSRIFRL